MKSCGRSPAAAAAAKSRQSCPTLCDPIDSSPPGFQWDSPYNETDQEAFPVMKAKGIRNSIIGSSKDGENEVDLRHILERNL